MILAVPYFEETGKLSMSLPNRLNFAFHFPSFLRLYMIAFLPGTSRLLPALGSS